MTQTKFEIQKRRGLKIDAGVRRGPPTGKQVGAQGKRGAAGSKLLGALLGAPSEDAGTTDAADATETGAAAKQDSKKA